MPASSRTECKRLADQFERSLRGGAWHGPSILETLADLTPAASAWRPFPEAHSVAGLVFHITFWIRDTALRLGGRQVSRGAGEDWRDDSPPGAWPAITDDLAAAHGELQAALRTLDDDRLGDALPGEEPTFRDLLLGLLQHNAYHAGQIASLRRAAARAQGGGA